MNICPQCGYENRLGVLICEDCGSNIYDASFGQTRVVADEAQDSHSGDAQYYAGSPTDNGEVVFQIVGAPSIRTRVEQTLILGRMNRNSPRRPDIDLTGCRAYEKGVSTEHAMLGREFGLSQDCGPGQHQWDLYQR